MGILAPLFLASLAALSLPLIFHLVRRTPRGKQEFSSLMFLEPVAWFHKFHRTLRHLNGSLSKAAA